NKDIYGYDLTTKEEFQIITGKSHQKHPALYKNIVVWADDKNGDLDIYGYDMITGQKILIVKHRGDQKHPALYENIVVWEDWRYGYPDIYGFDLSSFFTTDNDGDGYSPPVDCNDSNSGIHPGVEEICDGKDNDCNGLIDEGFDDDNDGYTTCGGDCDDSNSRIHPGAEEPCGKDYNCDGEVVPCTGTLKISVICEGTGLKADVYINGEYKGETDAQGGLIIPDLKAGTSYTVQVEQEGYTQQEHTVEIEEGTIPLDFEIEKESSIHVLLFFIPAIGLLIVVFILKFRKPKKEKAPRAPAEEKRRKKEEKPQKLTCPFCKNEIEENWVSCPYCGARLKDDTKVY
ncbi:MAG: PEGA domain-containing protein, partial [Theionarchaea archaeon]|nr:PEGA domain-containing protein [Theionarchaea archaeon]